MLKKLKFFVNPLDSRDYMVYFCRKPDTEQQNRDTRAEPLRPGLAYAKSSPAVSL